MKDAVLNIRISEPIRKKFIEVVNENNDTYSNVLRKFINFYIYKKGKWGGGDLSV